MRKYEVTIPFNRPPWYTGYAVAPDKTTAAAMVRHQAEQFGFSGRHKKIIVEVSK